MPTIYLLAFTVGVASGIRPLLTLAIVIWEVSLRRIDLGNAGLALFSSAAVRWIVTAGAIVELAVDNGPVNARRQFARFAPRVVAGAIAGAIVVSRDGDASGGLLCGVAGAVVGCLGGIATREEVGKLIHIQWVARFLEAIVVAVAVTALFGRGPI